MWNCFQQSVATLVESFVGAGELLDKSKHDFIQALQEVLSGLSKVVLKLIPNVNTASADGAQTWQAVNKSLALLETNWLK